MWTKIGSFDRAALSAALCGTVSGTVRYCAVLWAALRWFRVIWRIELIFVTHTQNTHTQHTHNTHTRKKERLAKRQKRKRANTHTLTYIKQTGDTSLRIFPGLFFWLSNFLRFFFARIPGFFFCLLSFFLPASPRIATKKGRKEKRGKGKDKERGR